MKPAIRYDFLLQSSLPVLARLPAAPADHGTAPRVKVHGKGLEGNLEGDRVDRDVTVCICHPATKPRAIAATRSSTCARLHR